MTTTLNIIEAEKLVRSELGPNYTPVKLGRHWLIHVKHADGTRELAAQTGSLATAIASVKASA
jgi:hypothetical protein